MQSSPPPTTKKQLQSLLGKINFLRRFIANSTGKVKAFSTLLKLKDSDTFEWRAEHQEAFTQIKVSLTTPSVLVPPRRGQPLKLYILTAKESIGCLFAQDNDVGREHAIFYLSWNLNPPEINYSAVEKLCLALFFTTLELRHYMLRQSLKLSPRPMSSVTCSLYRSSRVESANERWPCLNSACNMYPRKLSKVKP
ncbi:hypothetical protein EV1_029050 [Malus domestica]